MLSREDAENYAREILVMVQDRKVLKKIFLFGSLANLNAGRDADLIFEFTKKLS